MNFRAGSLIKPFDSKRRSRLRHTISLRTPLGCLQSHSLQTSCEMKRLLFSGCEPIIFLMVAISCLVTDRFRYVIIVSIPDTIDHQELERNLFLKKTCGEVLNPKLKVIIARERLPYFLQNCKKGKSPKKDLPYLKTISQPIETLPKLKIHSR